MWLAEEMACQYLFKKGSCCIEGGGRYLSMLWPNFTFWIIPTVWARVHTFGMTIKNAQTEHKEDTSQHNELDEETELLLIIPSLSTMITQVCMPKCTRYVNPPCTVAVWKWWKYLILINCTFCHDIHIYHILMSYRFFLCQYQFDLYAAFVNFCNINNITKCNLPFQSFVRCLFGVINDWISFSYIHKAIKSLPKVRKKLNKALLWISFSNDIFLILICNCM